MVDQTLEMIDTLDIDRFSSNIVKEYYEVLRELATIILLLDGYKIYGEHAHKGLIYYLENNKILRQHEVTLLDKLRDLRNRISYDGFFVDSGYVERKRADILSLILRLKEVIDKKIS